MIALAKRAASVAEMIAAGSIIVGLLQKDDGALAVGMAFMLMAFLVTWLVDLRERGSK